MVIVCDIRNSVIRESKIAAEWQQQQEICHEIIIWFMHFFFYLKNEKKVRKKMQRYTKNDTVH